VRLGRDSIRTSTIVMRSWSQTVRWITAEHARDDAPLPNRRGSD
jgi:fructose-1,6-bisphosphatase II / sedoheptulose-1,7-bisphosphatase